MDFLAFSIVSSDPRKKTLTHMLLLRNEWMQTSPTSPTIRLSVVNPVGSGVGSGASWPSADHAEQQGLKRKCTCTDILKDVCWGSEVPAAGHGVVESHCCGIQ